MVRIIKAMYWSVVLSSVLWSLGQLYMQGGVIDLLNERNRMDAPVLNEIRIMKEQMGR